MNSKRLWTLLFALVLVAAMIIGCASNSVSDSGPFTSSNSSSKGEADMAYEAEAPAAEPPREPASEDGFGRRGSDLQDMASQSGTAGQMGAKVIKTGYMAIETLEFDEVSDAIIRRVQMQGGYIESSNIQGVSRQERANAPMRRAQFRVRIPSSGFEQFLTDVGELGNVTRRESAGRDISGEYFDTEARVNTLKVQEERLVNILQEAVKLQDILELERELSRIRYEIENLTGTLQKWDNMVAYSTLEVEVREVEEIKIVEPTPVTLWEKIETGFRNSYRAVFRIMEFMLIFFISAVPFFILFGIIGIVVFIIVRLVLRRDTARKANKE